MEGEVEKYFSLLQHSSNTYGYIFDKINEIPNIKHRDLFCFDLEYGM